MSSTTSGGDDDQQSRALRRALRKHKRGTGGQQREPPQSVQEGQQHNVQPEETAPEAEMRRPMQEPPAKTEPVHVPREPIPPIDRHVQPVSSATAPVQEVQSRLEIPGGSIWMDTCLFIPDTIKGTICFLWQFIVSIFKIGRFIAPIWFIRWIIQVALASSLVGIVVVAFIPPLQSQYCKLMPTPIARSVYMLVPESLDFPICSAQTNPKANLPPNRSSSKGVFVTQNFDKLAPSIPNTYSLLSNILDSTISKLSELSSIVVFPIPLQELEKWEAEVVLNSEGTTQWELGFTANRKILGETINHILENFPSIDEEAIGFWSSLWSGWSAEASCIRKQQAALQPIFEAALNQTEFDIKEIKANPREGNWHLVYSIDADDFTGALEDFASEQSNSLVAAQDTLREVHASGKVWIETRKSLEKGLESRITRLKEDREWLRKVSRRLDGDSDLLGKKNGRMGRTALDAMGERNWNMAIEWHNRLSEHFVDHEK